MAFVNSIFKQLHNLIQEKLEVMNKDTNKEMN